MRWYGVADGVGYGVRVQVQGGVDTIYYIIGYYIIG
jgi:hypothetical protein